MRRPPLPSTLFPYTTLFRSVVDEVVARFKVSCQSPEMCPFGDDEVDAVLFCQLDQGEKGKQILHQRLDRKSTRLNSSHVAISYAVFCLKKKNERHMVMRSSN